jgi:hypothetical protein
LPHKDIALASAAIAALRREQERTVRLLQRGAAEKSRWRDAGRQASVQSIPEVPGKGWKG